MNRIVVLDGYAENPGDLSWAGFEQFGELTVYDRTPHDPQEIIRRIGQAQFVLTNKTPLTKTVLEHCENIAYIGLLSTGYNVIDLEAADKQHIPVCNIPDYCTKAVAQFTIALLLEICHHIGHHHQAVQEGQWSGCPDFCFWNDPQLELSGKTIGLLGFGKIGQATAGLAKALGMNVIFYRRSPYSTPLGRQTKNLEELFEQSDIISLHCPLSLETTGIICSENIKKMKDGVIILNSSRGGLVVEQDLAQALHTNKVFAAAVDVVSQEPITSTNPLLSAKNCIITPHMAWASFESRSRLMHIAQANIQAFIEGHPIHVVNSLT